MNLLLFDEFLKVLIGPKDFRMDLVYMRNNFTKLKEMTLRNILFRDFWSTYFYEIKIDMSLIEIEGL